jgi:hypothetical protein
MELFRMLDLLLSVLRYARERVVIIIVIGVGNAPAPGLNSAVPLGSPQLSHAKRATTMLGYRPKQVASLLEV